MANPETTRVGLVIAWFSMLTGFSLPAYLVEELMAQPIEARRKLVAAILEEQNAE